MLWAWPDRRIRSRSMSSLRLGEDLRRRARQSNSSSQFWYGARGQRSCGTGTCCVARPSRVLRTRHGLLDRQYCSNARAPLIGPNGTSEPHDTMPWSPAFTVPAPSLVSQLPPDLVLVADGVSPGG